MFGIVCGLFFAEVTRGASVVFCEAGASSGGRKSALYFDVSVSGRHIAYRSKFWKARREKGFKIDLHLHDLIHSHDIGHNG